MLTDKDIQKYIKQVQHESDDRLDGLMERHLGTLREDFGDQVRGLADNVAGVQETLGDIKKTLETHSEAIADLKVGMFVVQSDLKEIKSELRNKVDVKKFVLLEGRVTVLEKK